MKIYLVDLTHTSGVISSNIFPLAIGLIGAYLQKHLDTRIDIELFKDPNELNQKLLKHQPDIIGFSNYSWNEQLSLRFAKRIKEIYPETVIVFGGPNYGLEDSEINAYWEKKPAVDFYIVKEGEQAMLNLVNTLKELSVTQIKNKKLKIDNCHYLHEKEVIKGNILPRIEINKLPSPYLYGLMDKFFDVGFIPMIHTTRGCPFSCAFCTEGNTFYNKVSQRKDKILEELHYIAHRITTQNALYISDANFGMYKQDIEKAQILQEIKNTYNYPNSIVVSTGKNQKERVLSIAQMLNGSLNLAASVQSTDTKVLSNVKRSNINLSGLTEVGAKAVDKETGTYTEIILSLPGDNRNAHFKTLKDTIDSGFDIIRMYQLILLPQTELNTPECRRHYGMKSQYRIMPRSFGKYNILEKDVIVAESEQICISNDTLPLEDYLDCREMDLLVEIVHNGKIFSELYGLSFKLQLSWFDFLHYAYSKRYSDNTISKIFSDFRNENLEYLRNSHHEIELFVIENFDKLISDTISTNEMSSAKAKSVFHNINGVHQFVYSCFRQYIIKQEVMTELLNQYITELESFSINKKTDFFNNTDAELHHDYNFNFLDIEKNSYQVNFEKHLFNSHKRITFSHTQKQKSSINSLKNEYGTSLNGLSKMVMRQPYINHLFRSVNLRMD